MARKVDKNRNDTGKSQIFSEDTATTPELAKHLAYCPNLPTLPAVAVRIIELGHDPESDIGEISKVVSLDPALAAKMLRTANSAFYGARRKAGNLRQALTTLGIDAAMTIALSFSLSAALRELDENHLDRIVFWKRSILAALASQAVGKQLGMASLEDLFLAGLLQDIGILVLDSVLPEEYGRAVGTAADHEQLIAAERQLLGTDHADVGAWILRRWCFPDHIVLGVAASHSPSRMITEDLVPIAGCVALSGHIADIYLNIENENVTHQAANAAQQWLNLGDHDVSEILRSIAHSLQEVAQLFEIEVVDQRQVMAIIDSARELLIARNLRMIHKSFDLLDKAEWLEARTRILEEEGQRDVLTGLFNRRHLDKVLAKEFEDASQHGWPLSLGFIDLDHFKQVNDEQGHQVGDTVLTAFADLLRSNVRHSDVVARYGGEEFVVLLPGAPKVAARLMFQRILDKLAAETYKGERGAQFQVTASVGLATHMQDEERYDTMHDLLRAADRALYTAKSNGRNQMVLSSEY